MKSLRSLKKVKPPTTVLTLARSVFMEGAISLRELMRLLELAAGPRPFYLIAHKCNTPEAIKAAARAGANAIEWDIRFCEGKIRFVVNHDTCLKARHDNLEYYLDIMADVVRDNPHIALVYFDVKDSDPKRAKELLGLIRKRLTDKVPVNIIISHSDYEGRDLFLPLQKEIRKGEGVVIDEHDYPKSVSDFFHKKHFVRFGYGNGVAVPGVPLNIPRSVMEAVALKWSEKKIRFVYTFTLSEASSMRDYIAKGVDGIMVNNEDIPTLKAVLAEPDAKRIVRLAKRSDDPFDPPVHTSYTLNVETGNWEYMGTDANLTFELRGSEGSVSAKIDAYPARLFENEGDTNTVTLIGTDVGAVRELVLSQDGTGHGPDWFVRTVTLRKDNSKEVQTFDFDQWIRINRPARRTPALVPYKLVVSTTDKAWAGTDADVKFVLTGSKGTIEKEFDGGSLGRFESGNSDELHMQGIDIGKLKSVTVSHDGSGASDDWYLSKVTVKGGGINATVEFNGWVKSYAPLTKNV